MNLPDPGRDTVNPVSSQDGNSSNSRINHLISFQAEQKFYTKLQQEITSQSYNITTSIYKSKRYEIEGRFIRLTISASTKGIAD